MQTGTVRWYNPERGYGFIQPDSGGPDVFVHVTELERAGIVTLYEGNRIEFLVVPGRRGKVQASQLSLLRSYPDV